MAAELLFMDPVLKNNIWGGHRLHDDFGYTVPDGPVGECWGISAHPNGPSTIAEGTYKGMTLNELWDTHRELFGNLEGSEFPLLIKIIDAQDSLSIQVHPDNAYAAEHENGSLGKCECWYVLDAPEGGTIIVGQNAKNRAEFENYVSEGRWDDLVNEIPIKAGDFFQIDPGTVHAIKGGTLILETQQSSDITYRMYDYDRLQADGSTRELHLKQCADVIAYDKAAPTTGAVTNPEVDGITELESNNYYTVARVKAVGHKTLAQPHPFMNVSVVEGEGSVNGHALTKGTHFIAPYQSGDLEFEGNLVLIVSWV